MMHLRLNIIHFTFLLFFTLTSSTSHAVNQEQWPMFGGPNGNSQVTTKQSIETQWSVRTGKNIKWQVELPAGGQSGITVWGNQVFFTINKPLDTPKHSELIANYQTSKQGFEQTYQTVIDELISNGDQQLPTLHKNALQAEQTWQNILKQRKAQNLGILDIWAKRKTPEWKALSKHKKAQLDYVLTKNKTFKDTHNQYTQAETQLHKKGMGTDIVLYSLNANTGAIEWTKTIKGIKPAMYNYTFSDATSPSPATDGKHVWVVNSAGGMAAFTMQGKQVWTRSFEVSKDAPFNKQYDTILYKNLIFNVEPKAKGDTTRVDNWNYLHAFDKNTGKRLWVSEDGLTHYSTPVLAHTKKGVPAIMIGRGGPHEVPEKPQGLSLVDLRKETAGKSLWQWQAPQYSKAFGGIEIQTWDAETTYWQQGFRFDNFEIHQLDSSTGKFKIKHNLYELNSYEYDLNLQDYTLKQNPTLTGHWDRQPYTQVVIDNKLYYMVRYQPYIAMHDLTTGENTLIEIPTEVNRQKGKKDQLIWKTKQTTDQLNAQGQRHNTEARAQGDGTQKSFLGTPIVVNNKIFFTNAHGLTYVIDANKPFNPEALVAMNDLGEAGETVSLNAMAYSNGKLFHRSLKSIICIE
jgi:hypothetical protein